MNDAQLIHAAALAVISDRQRWTQNGLARSSDSSIVSSNSGEAVCWCSRGALKVVALNDPYKYRQRVEAALNKAAKKLGVIEDYIRFNDTHTHEEVMTMWQLAGKILATQ